MPNKNKFILDHFRAMRRGIKPGWDKIFRTEPIKSALGKALFALEADLIARGVSSMLVYKLGLDYYIRPFHKHIFEAFKYFEPQALKAVIIAPFIFPKVQHAHGLALSVRRGEKTPLPYIAELRRGADGNLEEWANQGVLMISTHLTRAPNILKNKDGIWVEGNGDQSEQFQHKFWEPFTRALVEYLLSKDKNLPIICPEGFISGPNVIPFRESIIPFLELNDMLELLDKKKIRYY